jgi:hypothetical protein
MDVKIAIDCEYNTSMLDHDLLHLGALLQRMVEHGSHGSAGINDDGMLTLTRTDDDDQEAALLTALGFMQQVYDEVEARSPQPKKPHPS